MTALTAIAASLTGTLPTIIGLLLVAALAIHHSRFARSSHARKAAGRAQRRKPGRSSLYGAST